MKINKNKITNRNRNINKNSNNIHIYLVNNKKQHLHHKYYVKSQVPALNLTPPTSVVRIFTPLHQMTNYVFIPQVNQMTSYPSIHVQQP